jgi:hypothetical protein
MLAQLAGGLLMSHGGCQRIAEYNGAHLQFAASVARLYRSVDLDRLLFACCAAIGLATQRWT